MEAIYAVQGDLEALAERLLKEGEASPAGGGGGEGLQELVTEAAVALVEYKGLARESFMAVEECRCVLVPRPLVVAAPVVVLAQPTSQASKPPSKHPSN